MTLEEAIFDRLSDDADVNTLIDGRAYPILAPQGAVLPYAVFARVQSENLAHLGGRGTHDRLHLSVIAYAETSADARGLADALAICLDEWSGHEVVAATRLIGREQAVVAETDVTPRMHSDALLFQMLVVET